MRWFALMLLLLVCTRAAAQSADVCATGVGLGGLQLPQACTGDRTACVLAPVAQLVDDDAPAATEPGAAVPASGLDALRTRVDQATNAWGIATLTGTALAADSWETFPFFMLVFGNADAVSRSSVAPHYALVTEASQGVNVRSLPREDARVLNTLARNEMIVSSGRLGDSAWVFVTLRDGRAGWATASAFSAAAVAALPVVDEQASPLALADLMPAFTRLSVTSDDARCPEGSLSGVILQTSGDAPLTFLLDDQLVLALRGTSLLRTSGDQRQLWIYLLDGAGSVFGASGRAQALVPGRGVTFTRESVSEAWSSEGSEARMDYETYAWLPLNLLPAPFYLPVDVTRYVRPRPEGDISPLAGMLATEACRATTGEGGANFRAGPGRNYPVVGVLGFRESVAVRGRASGSDGQNWWYIAPFVWISAATTVTGGDCVAVPEVSYYPPR
jgi:uncharacterized protein YraI